jgi:hypothetical protein
MGFGAFSGGHGANFFLFFFEKKNQKTFESFGFGFMQSMHRIPRLP